MNKHKKIKLIFDALVKEGYEITDSSFEMFCSLSHNTLDMVIEDLKIDLEAETYPINFEKLKD